MVGARIKIMWKEQLVDPPNEYIMAWLTSPTNVRGSHPFRVGLTKKFKGEKTQEEGRS